MTLTRREKIMIITGLIIVSIAAYSVYFIIPFFKNSGDAKTRINDAQSQLNVLNMQATGAKLLTDEITVLDNRLKDRGAAIPSGIDHARILLYLKDLTSGKAVGINIQVSSETALRDRFMLQPAAVDFQTTYPLLLKILDDLKQNKLYNQVSFLKVDYVPTAKMRAAPGSNADPLESAPTAHAAGNYVISVHMEMDFYALQPTDGEQPEPPLSPTNTERSNSLFPVQ